VSAPESLYSHAQHTRFFRIINALERSQIVSYILDSQYRLIYCNPAWDDFARLNNATQIRGERVIGLDLFATIPDVFKDFYRSVFAKASTKGVWEFSYECSSPNLFRKYRMRVHFLQTRALFVVTNPPICEKPHRETGKADRKKYVQPNGLIMMCAHCRCSQRVDLPDRWDFVSAYLRLKGKASLGVSHGFCPVCYAYFYC
jgi:hypothetical protein